MCRGECQHATAFTSLSLSKSSTLLALLSLKQSSLYGIGNMDGLVSTPSCVPQLAAAMLLPTLPSAVGHIDVGCAALRTSHSDVDTAC